MAKSKGFGTLMGLQSSVRPLIIYWLVTLVPFVLLLSIFHSQISAHIGTTISGIQSRVCSIAATPSSHDVVFYDYDEFQSLSSATDSAWNNLLTPNGGMLYSIDTSGRKVGRGISMFHQLHCLSMVRSKLQSLSGPDTGSERHHSAGERHDHAHDHHDLDNDHVLHCLDYIRQGILCAADDTLEPQKVSTTGSHIADYKRTHTCRDSERLYAASVESNNRMLASEF